MARKPAAGSSAKQPDARALALTQQAALEETLVVLASLTVGGLTAVEVAKAEGLRQAAARLVEVAEQIAVDGFTVPGSMGQLRPNPLLSEERALRKEIAEGLHKLDYQVRQRATFDRLRDLTRA